MAVQHPVAIRIDPWNKATSIRRVFHFSCQNDSESDNSWRFLLPLGQLGTVQGWPIPSGYTSWPDVPVKKKKFTGSTYVRSGRAIARNSFATGTGEDRRVTLATSGSDLRRNHAV